MGFMDLFKKNRKCAICGIDAGRACTASRVGYICPNCLRGLVKSGLNANSVEKYSMDELRKICSGANKK